MALISNLVRRLRKDPQLLFVRLPFVLSLSCILIGVVWLLVLPLNDFSRQTYISENALLPGQVHTYFAGSEQNIFRGYKKELEGIIEAQGGHNREGVSDELPLTLSGKASEILRAAGLKVASQKYEYTSAGVTYKGQNVYGIIQAPRGDATEAIVLVAAWRTADDELNLNGVTLALTLSRYFKRWSLWSKDIIVLISPDSNAGPQAWVDAYHDMHSPSVQSLSLKSGALQGAVAFEYPFDHHFESLHILYDGVNGQLPNLDLFNTAVSIASGQMGIGSTLQEMWKHDDSYEMRLKTMLRGMAKQALGYATGAHSYFIPYHIDAITLQTKGHGWQDEMALGRTIESLCRSLNNLLEHLHQSFFFYLLMQANRFVSIGTYLPSAMLIGANFTIMAIALWMRSGMATSPSPSNAESRVSKDEKHSGPGSTSSRDSHSRNSPGDARVLERRLALPLTLVVGLHLLGLVPLYVFNHLTHSSFTFSYYAFAVVNSLLPSAISMLLTLAAPTEQQYLLIKSFSLLLLGLSLSALATLNFSLSFLIGLLCTPLTFTVRLPPSVSLPLRIAVVVIGSGCLSFLCWPPTVLISACLYAGVSVESVLTQAAFGWHVWGMWTQVVVWCVWWPSWLIGCTLLSSAV